MPNRLLTCVLLFLCSLPCLAQLRGRVVDASTQEPIAYANVYYEGKGVGTASDQDGNFAIAAHAGWNQLTISYVGYQVTVVEVSADKQDLGDILLKSLELDEVIVKPKREKNSRKNNPAVEMMRKVIAAKSHGKLTETHDYVSHHKYEKMVLSVNDVTDKVFDDERLKLMPVQKAYPISSVLELLRTYDWTHQRDLTFEYIVFRGLNDDERHARQLLSLLRGLPCKVNLIRFHAIPDVELQTSDLKQMEHFRDFLCQHGLTATIRASRGEDIYAACGMLSSKKEEERRRK